MLYRRLFFALAVPLFFAVLAIASAYSLDERIDAITLGVNASWTGNGYKPNPADPGGVYDFTVTGSEAFPIDAFVSGGIRLTLRAPDDGVGGALTITPQAELGMRRYLLFENGRVVPTQRETALGLDEEGNPGLGSARVLTLRPVSYTHLTLPTN